MWEPKRTQLSVGVVLVLAFGSMATASVERQLIEASDGADFDSFGLPIALDGGHALVAATGADGAALGTGAVYALERLGTCWVEREKLVASDGDPQDEFGSSVALAGDLAVIGAPRDDDLGTDSGAAYLFRRGVTGWVEEQKLFASDGRDLHFFGDTAAIDENVIAVGAPACASDVPGWVYERASSCRTSGRWPTTSSGIRSRPPTARR